MGKTAPIVASTKTEILFELVAGSSEAVQAIVMRHASTLEDEGKKDKVNKLKTVMAEHMDVLKERIEASESQA